MYLGDVEQVRQRFERVGAAAGCCDDVGESGGTLVPSLPINDGAYHQPAIGTHIGELADTGGFVTNGAASPHTTPSLSSAARPSANRA